MANLQSLADRLRSELGDTGKSFVETFVADGTTRTFQLDVYPVDGLNMVVKVGTTDVSDACSVSENEGLIILDAVPAANAVITVAGTHYRYFTNTETEQYVLTAATEHFSGNTNNTGSLSYQLSTMKMVEEYPVIVLASSMALYTLATDAAFDIDIIAPDGVSIPRSERFRQLMELVQVRQAQYKELCQMLGLGMYKIDVFSLRRISRLTNRYVPIYQPQELDDGSLPQRAWLPIPSYGALAPQSTAITQDLAVYAGDDFAFEVIFGFDITDFTPKAEIRLYPNVLGNQVGPKLLGAFTISKSTTPDSSFLNRLLLTIPPSITKELPRVAYYDVQLVGLDGSTHTYVKGRVLTETQVTL